VIAIAKAKANRIFFIQFTSVLKLVLSRHDWCTRWQFRISIPLGDPANLTAFSAVLQPFSYPNPRVSEQKTTKVPA
jgi:hypothetical protein